MTYTIQKSVLDTRLTSEYLQSHIILNLREVIKIVVVSHMINLSIALKLFNFTNLHSILEF